MSAALAALAMGPGNRGAMGRAKLMTGFAAPHSTSALGQLASCVQATSADSAAQYSLARLSWRFARVDYMHKLDIQVDSSGACCVG